LQGQSHPSGGFFHGRTMMAAGLHKNRARQKAVNLID